MNGLIDLGWFGPQPIANIEETSKGYYHATSPDGGVSIGARNLASLKRILKQDGYAIGAITRYQKPKRYTVFDPF
jgi:predicted patatin/cPLA2 family phospholipase